MSHQVVYFPARGGMGGSAFQEAFDKLFRKKKAEKTEAKRDVKLDQLQQQQVEAVQRVQQVRAQSSSETWKYLGAAAAVAAGLIVLGEVLSSRRGR